MASQIIIRLKPLPKGQLKLLSRVAELFVLKKQNDKLTKVCRRFQKESSTYSVRTWNTIHYYIWDCFRCLDAVSFLRVDEKGNEFLSCLQQQKRIPAERRETTLEILW